MNDPNLFKGTAQYYSQYRMNYPKILFDTAVEVFGLNAESRVLDLGTGTGQLAIPFARIVGEVIAIDPEQEMLDEGKRVAQEQGIHNITWQQGKAEDISPELGMVTFTTIGAAFHWMDRDLVLQKIHAMTNEGGGL